MEFQAFPKIARLAREIVVTEKIDGTNAQVCIVKPDGELSPDLSRLAVAVKRDSDLTFMLAGKRNGWCTPEADNFGFAKWVAEHADELWDLGDGRHYGEWWGSGIQRGYGLTKGEKRFSLFNVARWADDRDREKFPADRPACCGVVPTLYRGPFSEDAIIDQIMWLRTSGSKAAPGFMQPEGVVIFHTASGTLYKRTLEKDDEPKSKHAA